MRLGPAVPALLLLPAVLAGCGDAPTTPETAPEPRVVRVEYDWALVAAGDSHTCGVTANGRAYCWGENDHGQLGSGRRRQGGEPMEVDGGRAWSVVTVGDEHSCGVTTDGDALCWGGGEYGQLGAGSRRSARSPVEVAGGHRWVGTASANLADRPVVVGPGSRP